MSVPTPFRNPDSTSGGTTAPEPNSVAAERADARRRLEERRKVISDVVSYVVINAFLVFLWFITGAATSGRCG